MMKVLKVLLAVCLCALLLSGCGDKETADTVPKSNRPETQAPYSGNVCMSTEHCIFITENGAGICSRQGTHIMARSRVRMYTAFRIQT